MTEHVDTVDDDIILTGEPFKVGTRWFRAVCEKPGFVRLTWGRGDDWANWHPLDFWVVPEADTAASILLVSNGQVGG